MKKFIIIIIFLCLAYLYHSHGVALAQEKHEVTVTMKLIPVIVVDKEMQPVRSLTREDFILQVDGRPVDIAAFEAHFLAEQRPTEKGPAQPARLAVSSEKARQFFLLFDYSQSDLWGIKKAKQLGLEFIDTLQPEDKISIIAYARDKGLVFYLFSSTDHQKAKSILESLTEIPTTKQLKKAKDESWLGSQKEEIERQWLQLKAINFVSGLGELVKILSYVPGNKNIILFSGGIPRYYLYESRSLPDKFNLQEIKPGLFDRFTDLARSLASAGCRVYAVNSKGHKVYLSSSSWARGDDSLRILTDHSGGRYFPDIAATKKVVDDLERLTGSYYVLGYYVEEKWDGRYHQIEVKLQGEKKNKFRLYYQKGYFNPRPYAELSDFEKKLDLFMLATEGKSAYFPLVEFPSRAFLTELKGGKGKVFLELDLAGLKKQDFLSGVAEWIIFIMDEKGYILQIKRRNLLLSKLPADKLVVKFHLLSGIYKLRSVFRDTTNGNAALSTTSITIPKKDQVIKKSKSI